MKKAVLQILPIQPLPGSRDGEGESQGICLYDYCAALKAQPGSAVVASGEDGYGIAMTLEQTRGAYLSRLQDESWQLQFPREEHRRRWVKNVVEISIGAGGKME